MGIAKKAVARAGALGAQPAVHLRTPRRAGRLGRHKLSGSRWWRANSLLDRHIRRMRESAERRKKSSHGSFLCTY